MSPVLKASAPETTASGLPDSGPVPKTSTKWMDWVMVSLLVGGGMVMVREPAPQLRQNSSFSPASANTAESVPSIRRRHRA